MIFRTRANLRSINRKTTKFQNIINVLFVRPKKILRIKMQKKQNYQYQKLTRPG